MNDIVYCTQPKAGDIVEMCNRCCLLKPVGSECGLWIDRPICSRCKGGIDVGTGSLRHGKTYCDSCAVSPWLLSNDMDREAHERRVTELLDNRPRKSCTICGVHLPEVGEQYMEYAVNGARSCRDCYTKSIRTEYCVAARPGAEIVTCVCGKKKPWREPCGERAAEKAATCAAPACHAPGVNVDMTAAWKADALNGEMRTINAHAIAADKLQAEVHMLRANEAYFLKETDRLRKEISDTTELKQELASLKNRLYEATTFILEKNRRDNELSDACGTLKSENDELLRENGRLRRAVEKLEKRK